jgi:hypothetical protein
MTEPTTQDGREHVIVIGASMGGLAAEPGLAEVA